MLFILLLVFLGILWFLDEVLTAIEVQRHGILSERNPVVRKFIKKGGHIFFYFKVITFAVFCAISILAYSISQVAFYILVTIAIIIYGIIDIRNLDVLRKG